MFSPMSYFRIFVKYLIITPEWVCFWIIYPVLLIYMSISLPTPPCLWLLLFSCSVMSDSLRSHELQHTNLSCTSRVQEFAQTHVHWVDDTIQPFHPLSLPSLALNLSQHQGFFQWVGYLHQMSKVWEFSLSISSSIEYSGLIFFRIDWFDLFAV